MNEYFYNLSVVCAILSTLSFLIKRYRSCTYSGSLQQKLDRVHGIKRVWFIKIEVTTMIITITYIFSV